MKTKFFIYCMLLTALQAAAQSRVQATISNIENNRGVCRACIFSNATAFNGEGGSAVQCAVVPVVKGSAQANFEKLPPGRYAVFVFHDANNNNKMDKNFAGIPKEGYGASRNKLPFAAAPTFNANAFTITANTTTLLQIRLRNL